jgi:histidine triad (HIT) family protein
MVLTDEQANTVKEQLFEQIKNSKLDNKEKILEHLKNLDSAGLEAFMTQNNIPNPFSSDSSNDPTAPSQEQPPACIFCSIIKKEMSSYIIDENDKNLAVLELNPLSKGHSIIIPKEHIHADQMPKSTLSLAQKIGKRIKKKLKPEDIKIETSSFQGHSFVNIIPIYKDGKLEKKKAEESELEEVKKILEVKKRGPRTRKVTTSTGKKEKIPKINRRVP